MLLGHSEQSPLKLHIDIDPQQCTITECMLVVSIKQGHL